MTRRGAKPAAEVRRVAARPAGRKAAAFTLALQLADAGDRALLSRPRVRRWLAAALQRPAEITLRVVDEAEGRALNRDYRGKDYATNVLTFDYSHAPVVSADLILCAPVVEAEAREQKVSLEAHYAHLLVHGTLHAQGHDHEDEAEAQVMESQETAILAALGFDDPYAR
jgi:probable rRNA maturation factor